MALVAADVARERHYEEAPRESVGRLVVRREDEDLGVAVIGKEPGDRLGLGPSVREESADAPPGREGLSPVGAARRGTDELGPGRSRHGTPEACLDDAELRDVLLVGTSLVGRELEPDHEEIEAREERPGEVADSELVDSGAEQLDETGRRRPVARRSGAEPEARWRERHLERLVADVGAEVVGLVDHEQVEAVADLGHAAPGALEGGDRDRREFVGAVAVAADRTRVETIHRTYL